MKHIRMPITDRHPSARSYEGAWCGYIYAWQSQRNGAIATRVQWFDPRYWPNRMVWEETKHWDPLGEDAEVSFEQDMLDIIDEHRPYIYESGMIQHKVGSNWVTVGV